MLTAFAVPRKRKAVDDRVYLVHADELKFDMYGPNPDAQIVKVSLIAYVIPLVFLMAGLVIGQNVLGSDGWAAGLGVGLLAVGLLVVRLIDKRLGGKPCWKPKLIKVFEEMPHPLNDD